MIASGLQEALKCHAIVQVISGVDFVAKVNTGFVVGIQDW